MRWLRDLLLGTGPAQRQKMIDHWVNFALKMLHRIHESGDVIKLQDGTYRHFPINEDALALLEEELKERRLIIEVKGGMTNLASRVNVASGGKNAYVTEVGGLHMLTRDRDGNVVQHKIVLPENKIFEGDKIKPNGGLILMHELMHAYRSKMHSLQAFKMPTIADESATDATVLAIMYKYFEEMGEW